MLSDKSKENISSDYGKQLRLNRSIQVEGAFAVLKEDMKLKKIKSAWENKCFKRDRIILYGL